MLTVTNSLIAFLSEKEMLQNSYLVMDLAFVTYTKAEYFPGESLWRFLHDIAL